MFKRRRGDAIDSNTCPYCEFINAAGASTCIQCYYEMEKSAREQGESVSSEVSNSIFDELMSEEDDSWDDGEALDVVLTMDQEPLVVDQYETTDFSSEEPEEVGFMDSRAPELHNTVIHQVEKVSIEDVGDAPKDYSTIDLSGHDPLAEVAEPVHSGRGTVFSPEVPKMDDDLLGHIGGSELPSLPPDDMYDNKVDLTGQGAPPPPAPIIQEPVPEVIKAPPPTPAIALPEFPIVQASVEEPTPAPEPEDDGRFWPWPAAEPWDPRQIHREVVSALEDAKSGKIESATKIIEELGPHLDDANVDLLYHIGLVLKQIGRENDVSWMLARAHSALPESEHVSSAVAHLGVN